METGGIRKHRVYFGIPACHWLVNASPKPKMVAEIYGRLNLSLVRSVARAIMGRELTDRL